jgi:hypothetical protein
VSIRPPISAALVLLAGTLVLGCGGGSSDSPSGGSGGSGGGGGSAAPGQVIEITDAGGAKVYELEPSDKGYQIEDPDGKKLGTIKVESDRVKVADASGKATYKIKQKASGFKLYREPAVSGGADVELAQYAPDGKGFRIKDASEKELYRGKDKDTKIEVSGPESRSYVVKSKPDGMEVEDPAGKRLLRVKGLDSAAAAIFNAAPEYDTLQKAAVTAYAARIAK